MKYRSITGSLEEAMKLMVELEPTLTALAFYLDINPGAITVEPYFYDVRIDWDTHVVKVNGVPVGLTDRPIQSAFAKMSVMDNTIMSMVAPLIARPDSAPPAREIDPATLPNRLIVGVIESGIGPSGCIKKLEALFKIDSGLVGYCVTRQDKNGNLSYEADIFPPDKLDVAVYAYNTVPV